MAAVNLFNEKWYLERYPDVAEAVRAGAFTAEQHFNQFGKAEGRGPGPLFNPDHYLASNPDIKAAVEAGHVTAFDHFVNFGMAENRSPLAMFDVDFYLAQNPDVAQAVASGATSAVQHFLLYGQNEARSITPALDLASYLHANPDIALAVEAGLLSALDHLLTFGLEEGRNLGNGVDLALFREDAAFSQALATGNLDAAWARVDAVAPFLPGFVRPEGWSPAADMPIPLDFKAEGVKLVVPAEVVVPEGTTLPDTFAPVAPATPGVPAPNPGGSGGGGGGPGAGDPPVNILDNPVYAGNPVYGADYIKVAVAKNGSTFLPDIQIGSGKEGVFTVDLSADSGTITVDTAVPGGLAAAAISNNGTQKVTLTGSKSAINATLAGAGAVTYAANMEYSGNDYVTIKTTDADGLSDSDQIGMSVLPVSFDLSNNKLVIQGDMESDGIGYMIGHDLHAQNPSFPGVNRPEKSLEFVYNASGGNFPYTTAYVLDSSEDILEIDASGVNGGVWDYDLASFPTVEKVAGGSGSDSFWMNMNQLGGVEIDGGGSSSGARRGDGLDIQLYDQELLMDMNYVLDDSFLQATSNIGYLSIYPVGGGLEFTPGEHLETLISNNDDKNFMMFLWDGSLHEGNLSFDGSFLVDQEISLLIKSYATTYSSTLNTIIGGPGNDYIDAGDGPAVVDGGNGNDIYQLFSFTSDDASESSMTRYKKIFNFVDGEDRFRASFYELGYEDVMPDAHDPQKAHLSPSHQGENAIVSTNQAIDLDQGDYFFYLHRLFILNAGDIGPGTGYANTIEELLGNFSTDGSAGFKASELGGYESFIVATAATADYGEARVNLWLIGNRYDDSSATIDQGDFIALIGTFTGGGVAGSAADFTAHFNADDFI